MNLHNTVIIEVIVTGNSESQREEFFLIENTQFSLKIHFVQTEDGVLVSE